MRNIPVDVFEAADCFVTDEGLPLDEAIRKVRRAPDGLLLVLRTYAKLYKHEQRYVICTYHHSDYDAAPYVKPNPLLVA